MVRRPAPALSGGSSPEAAWCEVGRRQVASPHSLREIYMPIACELGAAVQGDSRSNGLRDHTGGRLPEARVATPLGDGFARVRYPTCHEDLPARRVRGY